MSSSINEADTRTRVAGFNWIVRVMIFILLLGVMVGLSSSGSIAGEKVLTDHLSEPLNGATAAKIDIDTGGGNLIIDRLTGGEQLLAVGTLQYVEGQALPTRTAVSFLGQTTLALKGGNAGQTWFRLPWTACNGATEWHVHISPDVQSDITAHAGGGNITLNLAGMAVSRVLADTGGGNVDVVLPDSASGLDVMASTGAGNVNIEIGSGITGGNSVHASSGAGNVDVRLPSGIAAKVHATTGLGKVIVDPRLSQIDASTYQSPEYDSAADRVEIALKSGAGNASVSTK
jgi:hypothetical protein